MTVGFDVFVQLVIAAITTEPSDSPPESGTPPSSTSGLRAEDPEPAATAGERRWSSIDLANTGTEARVRLSSGFLGPAIEGSILSSSM